MTSFLLMRRRYSTTPTAATTTNILFLPPHFLSLGNHEKVEPIVVGGREQDFDEKPGLFFIGCADKRCSAISGTHKVRFLWNTVSSDVRAVARLARALIAPAAASLGGISNGHEKPRTIQKRTKQ